MAPKLEESSLLAELDEEVGFDVVVADDDEVPSS